MAESNRKQISQGDLTRALKSNFSMLPSWKKLVDDKFHFDFTMLEPDAKTFYRGGREYHRPIGWMRYALSVAGRFEDDDWLGIHADNDDDKSDAKEWPVAYHGTNRIYANPISSDGFR